MNLTTIRLRKFVRGGVFGVFLITLTGCETMKPMMGVGHATEDVQRPEPVSELEQQQARASLAYSKSRNIESTLFIDNMRASVSLRATVGAMAPRGAPEDSIQLQEGYTFQFRSINKETVSVGSVIIQAGNDTVVVKSDESLNPSGKGFTMRVDLQNSRRINPKQNATVVFNYQGKNMNVILREHQLVDIFETAMR